MTVRLGNETLCWKNGSKANDKIVMAAPTETKCLVSGKGF